MTGEQNYQIIAKNNANTLVNKLSIPDPLKIIEKFRIKVIFSDLTYEDLSEKELVDELIEKKILDEIEERSLANFGKSVDLVGDLILFQ